MAVVGCIADHYLPKFSKEFAKEFPDYWGKNIKEPFDAYYETEIGRVAQALNFGLKDSVSNVVRLQNFLITIRGPGEVFLESSYNYLFRKKYEEIRRKYDELMKRAVEFAGEKIVFFEYGGELSISADIANELSHKFKDKIISVAYRKGEVVNLSMRGKNVKRILERILRKINGRGGGHEEAVGAQVSVDDLGKFREELERVVGENTED